MWNDADHVDDLTGHIDRVRSNALVLAHLLMKQGRSGDARLLLSKAHVHDQSKWAGIEWEYMHRGPDVDRDMLNAAIAQHQKTNDHHPEFWGGLKRMPEICVAEMVCDWLARSQEMATNFREYVQIQASERFDFRSAPDQAMWISTFTELLLPEKFAKRT